MESGETIHVSSIGKEKIGLIDRTTVDGTPYQDQFTILLEEGDVLDDGDHFLSEFEPVPGDLNLAQNTEPALSSAKNFLKLNKTNGF
ncbi:MAG TPA: hypothetical protein VGE26_04115 [Sphingobacteriaceae bacterium]